MNNQRQLIHVHMNEPGHCSFHSTSAPLSHFPPLQLSRITPSQWLSPISGMDFFWHCTCSLGSTLPTRAHSFPRNFEPPNLSFYEPSRGIRLFATEFDVFHSNNFFLSK